MQYVSTGKRQHQTFTYVGEAQVSEWMLLRPVTFHPRGVTSIQAHKDKVLESLNFSDNKQTY